MKDQKRSFAILKSLFKVKSNACLVVLILSFFLVSGCSGNSSGAKPKTFLAKCYEVSDKLKACMKKLELIPNSAVQLVFGDVNFPISKEDSDICFNTFSVNMKKAFQLLPEEKRQSAQDTFSEEFYNLSQEANQMLNVDPSHVSQCSSKITDKEKYLCFVELALNASKEKICKTIDTV